jgi:hypothetical protein
MVLLSDWLDFILKFKSQSNPLQMKGPGSELRLGLDPIKETIDYVDKGESREIGEIGGVYEYDDDLGRYEGEITSKILEFACLALCDGIMYQKEKAIQVLLSLLSSLLLLSLLNNITVKIQC